MQMKCEIYLALLLVVAKASARRSGCPLSCQKVPPRGSELRLRCELSLKCLGCRTWFITAFARNLFIHCHRHAAVVTSGSVVGNADRAVPCRRGTASVRNTADVVAVAAPATTFLLYQIRLIYYLGESMRRTQRLQMQSRSVRSLQAIYEGFRKGHHTAYA